MVQTMPSETLARFTCEIKVYKYDFVLNNANIKNLRWFLKPPKQKKLKQVAHFLSRKSWEVLKTVIFKLPNRRKAMINALVVMRSDAEQQRSGGKKRS